MQILYHTTLLFLGLACLSYASCLPTETKSADEILSDSSTDKTSLLVRRSNTGKGTWYAIHPGDKGACGDSLYESDYIVALNQPQYGDLGQKSSWCGKSIAITSGGKTAHATVVDACPEGEQCHWGALDMSKSLFSYFTGLDAGVIDIEWHEDKGSQGQKGSPHIPAINFDQSMGGLMAGKADITTAADQGKIAAEKSATEHKPKSREHRHHHHHPHHKLHHHPHRPHHPHHPNHPHHPHHPHHHHHHQPQQAS